MAKSALNYLRGNPDPTRSYECKFSLGPLGIPCHVPEIVKPNQYGFDPVSLGDTDCRMDWQYPHMRQMAGQHEADPVERSVRQRVLGYLRDDHYAWINPAAYIGEQINGLYIGSWTTAKLLYSLAEECHRTGEAWAKNQARQIFLALKKLAVWKDGKPYYMGIAPSKSGEWLLKGWCTTSGRNYPFVVEPLLRYWECTGDAEALEFAISFSEGFLAGVQPDMGKQRINPETGAFEGHVHLHTHAVWGMAHLGAVTGERRYLDWAEHAYRFVQSQGTDYGWYPEFVPQGEYRTEICVVGDMVSIAANLARADRPDFWDHVDRTVRNELRQAQFSLTPAFVDLFRDIHRGRPQADVDRALTELQKLEGGFAAQPTFDDWVSYPNNPQLGTPGMCANGIHMMGCCPPEGMRGLWEAWNGIVEERKEGVFVNLHITRDHPAARITAHDSAAGRTDVHACMPGTYYLRPPAYTDISAVQLLRNGQKETVRFGGPGDKYVVCQQTRRNDKLTLRWSVPRFRQTFRATSVPHRDQTVSVNWLGNEVLSVEPRGHYLPMFGSKALH